MGNASSMRDFRVQLRGSRSVLLFGAYLLSLITIALLVYSSAIRNGTSVSIVEAQSSLQSFYATVIGLLGGMICLVTPALCATSILTERQRKSLDLVFSAPVSPKYYLVGKMLSSYRYIWMLLVLSLPVTAACVVLGGATWRDVLLGYLHAMRLRAVREGAAGSLGRIAARLRRASGADSPVSSVGRSGRRSRTPTRHLPALTSSATSFGSPNFVTSSP
jgi:hypothetical protein